MANNWAIGFKNSTDGNPQVAINAMGAAQHPHSFLGINREGRTSIVHTIGNPDAHIVLRGGDNQPNYFPEDIAATGAKLAEAGLNQTIMVDCSHANSFKNHERQEEVLNNVIDQALAGNPHLSSLMIESNLEAGNQSIPSDLAQLKYGVSITDKCVDWATTERMLRYAHAKLKEKGGRPI